MTNKPAKSLRKNDAGFTLIELLLAMTFVAFIMLFVVLVLIQTMAIYNKGMAMRQINEAGRQIGEDVTRQMRYTNASALQYSPEAQRLCVGTVTYVWNLGDVDSSNISTAKNKFATPDDGRALKMVRVSDPTQKYCANTNLPIELDQSVTTLAGTQVIVQQVSVDTHDADVKPTPGLVDINMVFTTTGDNKPQLIDGHWQCFFEGKTNQFCAFGEFTNTVYMRGN